MNEVAKLYKNAGINKREIENCTYKNSTPCGHSCDDGEDCPYLEIKNDYPPFTAEKQLEVVKQILFSTWWMNLKRLQFSEKFDEGLAQMINELWQSLTDTDKAQIKEILE